MSTLSQFRCCFSSLLVRPSSHIFFFFNDTATTEIYTLSLHDALPISDRRRPPPPGWSRVGRAISAAHIEPGWCPRSEEHTSELQSHLNLVCRLLLEKKKIKHTRGNWNVQELVHRRVRGRRLYFSLPWH